LVPDFDEQASLRGIEGDYSNLLSPFTSPGNADIAAITENEKRRTLSEPAGRYSRY
jgi:hypothetical protein